ncbi:threonine dehydratase [Massilia endophytica]|uniref:threonine dehydratase n=1 Tax=Massilia endophytica TaxID=2899220 RepID=UPI001E2A820D|nr:threonine dehydratase [Massilia endophytica]UGQ44678.1 threonine dehydratase [Massilia endophytica]
MFLPDAAALASAADIVYQFVPPTPQYSWPQINAALGTEAWVKHENHTPLGSFKARGGVVYVRRLLQREPELKGLIAATRGNHGQSVAFAAREHGLKATIVVPHGNSAEKNAAMRSLGAQLIEHGEDFQASREYAQVLAVRDGLHIVPSYHEDIVAGVGSSWMELFRAQPDLDTVFVPIGQGSGFCGAIAARQALGLRTRVIGVVSALAPAYQLSFQARRSVEAPVSTMIADGMACRVADSGSLACVLEFADDVVTVSDESVAAAMRLYFSATHNVAEGAGAAALAAALQLKDDSRVRGCRIGLPLTGGNVDASLFRTVLES